MVDPRRQEDRGDLDRRARSWVLRVRLAYLVELNTGLTTDVVVLLALPYVRPGAQLESMLSHEITQGSTTQAFLKRRHGATTEYSPPRCTHRPSRAHPRWRQLITNFWRRKLVPFSALAGHRRMLRAVPWQRKASIDFVRRFRRDPSRASAVVLLPDPLNTHRSVGTTADNLTSRPGRWGRGRSG